MNKKEYYEIELFHWAGMLSDNIEQVKKILTAHPEYLYEINRLGDNCLLVAIQSGNINIVNFLIKELNIDINFQYIDNFDIPRDNALMCAIKNNQKEIVDLILEQKNINLRSINNKGKNIYHLAAFNGDANIIEKLIVLDKEQLINKLDFNNQHCLYDFIDNYMKHKDFWCFDLILENINKETLMSKNKQNLNIIEYMEDKIKENSFFSKEYTPLLNLILNKI